MRTYGSQKEQDIFEYRESNDGEEERFGAIGTGDFRNLRGNEGLRGSGEGTDDVRDAAGHERVRSYEDALYRNEDKSNSLLSNGDHQDKIYSLHSSMLPPTIPHGHQSEPSTISTVPFTSPAHSTPKETVSFEFHGSGDRMPTPTVSSKSRSDAEKEFSSRQSSVQSKKRSITEMEEDKPSPSFKKLSQLENNNPPHPNKTSRTEGASDRLPSTTGRPVIEEDIAQNEKSHGLPSMIDDLMQSLPYRVDRAAIEKTLDECGGNVNLAASRLLDATEQGADFDELSLPVSSLAASSAKTRSSKPDKKSQRGDAHHNDELGSDDVHIGFPKEQYQPRPSRSRSGRVDGEDLVVPVDFSKRPETLGKTKRSKRRKTTALAKPTPKYEDEGEGEEEVVPLFSVPTPAKSVDSNVKITTKPGNLDTTGVDPIGQSEHGALLAAGKPASKKQRGRPHKKMAVPQDEIPELFDDGNEDLIAKIAEEFPTKETLEISKSPEPKRQRGRSQKKAVEEALQELLPFENDGEQSAREVPEDQDTDNPKPAAPKKQRGRPKKNPLKASEEDVLSDNQEPPPLQKPDKRKPSTTLIEPPILNDDSDDVLQPPSDTRPKEPLTETQPKSPQKAPPPPSTPNKAKGPDKHSPLQSSKVRYRVGLSKRARIEPLLRVVRK